MFYVCLNSHYINKVHISSLRNLRKHITNKNRENETYVCKTEYYSGMDVDRACKYNFMSKSLADRSLKAVTRGESSSGNVICLCKRD
jgi:hypothetical protein